MTKILVRLFVVLALAAAGWGGYKAFKAIPQAREASVPTAKVRQGEVMVRTYARGELRAVRSQTLTAPNLFGTVQVTKLAPLGSFAREKDLVIEFDDSELLSRLEEKDLEIEQIDQQIKKAQSDLAIRANQDEVELLRSKYAVRRAELEVKRNELISAIDAKRNLLTLEESQRRLSKLESDIKSRREQAEAQLATLREQRNKAVLELNREKTRLSQTKVLSPMSGLVAIKQARGFFMFGQQQPDIREGDQVSPGSPVAEILDLSEVEILSRIGELDRANLNEGQDVIIALDALADKRLTGKIKSMSGTASANIFSSDPAKKFDVIFSVDMKQLLNALGATPEQVSRVLATAEANRKKAPAGGMFAGGFGGFAGRGGGGGFPGGGGFGGAGGGGGFGGAGGGGGFPGGGGGGFGGGAPGGEGPGGGLGMSPGGPGGGGFQGQRGAGGGGGRGGFGGAGMTDEQRTQMRAAMEKALGGKSMQDLSPEERQAVFAKVQEEMRKAGVTMPSRGGTKGGGEAKGGAAGERKGGEQSASAEGGRGQRGAGGPGGPGGAGGAEAGEGGGRRRGAGGGPGGGGFGGGGGMVGGFSDADRANAKLPPPPEEDSQLDVLLRPGLLADVEIIVERIPNAIYVPFQSVFEREGKTIVFVRENGKFVPRVVKPLKRTESAMVIQEGLKPGEEVAMQDPDAKPDQKKAAPKGGGGGAPMMPGGKKG